MNKRPLSPSSYHLIYEDPEVNELLMGHQLTHFLHIILERYRIRLSGRKLDLENSRVYSPAIRFELQDDKDLFFTGFD